CVSSTGMSLSRTALIRRLISEAAWAGVCSSTSRPGGNTGCGLSFATGGPTAQRSKLANDVFDHRCNLLLVLLLHDFVVLDFVTAKYVPLEVLGCVARHPDPLAVLPDENPVGQFNGDSRVLDDHLCPTRHPRKSSGCSGRYLDAELGGESRMINRHKD